MNFHALIVALTSCSAELIVNLPGAPTNASFRQFSGYFDVVGGYKDSSHLHYWFVESQNNPTTDPVLLWLNGGPGCSSLFGLLTEWGPYWVNEDGATLWNNPYAWNRNASVLALESPGGVGYSYIDEGCIRTYDQKVARENWLALKEFFNEFPQFRDNDFYITGESYAGTYIPTLTKEILDKQNEFHINIKVLKLPTNTNFKGFAIGNGCVKDSEEYNSLIQFLYNHGVVDEETWQKAARECCDERIDSCEFHKFLKFEHDHFCYKFVNKAYSAVVGLRIYNMYGDCANKQGTIESLLSQIEHSRSRRHTLDNDTDTVKGPCASDFALQTYLNREDVRVATHVKPDLPKWEGCNELLRNYGPTVEDTTEHFKHALDEGLRVLLYYGDIDLACNFLMGQRFAKSLGYKKTKDKTAFFVNKREVGGYHTKYGNLEFVTILGAGHMVPTDKPAAAFHIIDAFLNGRDISKAPF